MRLFTVARLAFVAALLLTGTAAAATRGELVSTMRNVNAVPEAHGYRINPAYDAAAEMGPEDLAPVQAFEIYRPDGGPVSIGRLYTSCTCIQLYSPKRNFEMGERAVLQMRNIAPTPFNGQVYAIYVQITSPVRATLRFDTFVQSRTGAVEDEAAPATAETTAVGTVEESPTELAQADGMELIVPSAATATEAATGTAASAAETVAEAATDAVADVVDETRATVDAARAEMDAYFDAEAGATSETAAQPSSDQSANAPVDSSLDDMFAEMERDAAAPLPPPAELVAEAPAAETPAASSVRPPAASVAPPPAAAPVETPVAAPAAPVAPTPEPATPAAPVVAAVVEPTAPAAPAAPAIAATPAGKPLEMVSLITIGVRDMGRSVRFYEELGWRRASRNKYDQTAFFQLNGQVLALYPLPDLLKEQNMESAAPAPGGITLAIHVANKKDVEPTYRSFINAGGVSLKEPAEMPSGAVTSYVADPDGNPWEISWVPQFRVDADGNLWLP